MAFVDTMGTLIGLSARAGFLDERGNLPQIERPMMADALATVLAPLFGTTTSGAFVESATGIEAGGRTGLTAVVVASALRSRPSPRHLSPPFRRRHTARR